MKKPFLANNEIYHVFNRGVEKRDIFLDESDYSYFVHNLYILNDQNNRLNTSRDFISKTSGDSTLMEVGLPSIKREPLVDIFIFTLMPNHFHLMLRQRVKGGVSKFMQKLGTSTTKRFNEKYDRVGPLFQGKFKAVLVKKDAHFMYLPYYIHLNPMVLIDGSPTSINKKVGFLEGYKWSSLPDYIGKKNFPSVISKDFLLEQFGNEKKYKKSIEKWLKHDDTKEMLSINEVLIDY